MADRDSTSGELELITDPEQKARVEAANALRQTKAAMDRLPAWIRASHPDLRPSLFLQLHRTLMKNVSQYPGVFRPMRMTISHSQHMPPPADEVPALMEELCEYVNKNWSERSAIHLAAYVLWRTNWIHPFADGNGRTARIVSYLVLCAHTKTELPGALTIPKQIAASKKPYYDALEDADRHFRGGKLNVSAIEELLEVCLARQLVDFFQSAGGRTEDIDQNVRAEIDEALIAANSDPRLARNAEPILPSIRKQKGLIDQIEAHPAFTNAILVVISVVVTIGIAIFGWLFFRQ